MTGKTLRKTVILAAKLAVAGALLWYVISKVHWNDYAVTLEGRETRVYSARGQGAAARLEVAGEGSKRVWLEAGRFRAVALTTRDGRPAMVIKALPDWQSPSTYQVHLDGRRQELPVGDFRAVALDDADWHTQFVNRGFRDTVLSANKLLLAASFACFIAPVVITSVRWWYLLAIQEIHVPFREALRLTFLGTFFNFVVPGTVSGDLVKAYYVARHTERKAAVLVTIFVDRAVGLLEFAILPAIVMLGMVLAGAGGVERLAMPAVMVAVVLAGALGAMALLLSARLRRMLQLQKLVARLPLQRHLAVAAQAANLYRRRLPALLKALAMTLGGQASFIIAILLAGLSLTGGTSATVPWYQYFLYVPLIYIIAAVPISPGGLGLTEAFFVTFFTPAGASPSQVLALALVARLFPMIVSLPGIVVAMTGPKLPKTAEMRAALDAGGAAPAALPERASPARQVRTP